MATHTRIVQITAARTYVGQHTIEIPAWCANQRLVEIVRRGGRTARILSERMVFGRVQGTGLAHPLISDAPGIAVADFPLSDLTDALRADGYMF